MTSDTHLYDAGGVLVTQRGAGTDVSSGGLRRGIPRTPTLSIGGTTLGPGSLGEQDRFLRNGDATSDDPVDSDPMSSKDDDGDVVNEAPSEHEVELPLLSYKG